MDDKGSLDKAVAADDAAGQELLAAQSKKADTASAEAAAQSDFSADLTGMENLLKQFEQSAPPAA